MNRRDGSRRDRFLIWPSARLGSESLSFSFVCISNEMQSRSRSLVSLCDLARASVPIMVRPMKLVQRKNFVTELVCADGSREKQSTGCECWSRRFPASEKLLADFGKKRTNSPASLHPSTGPARNHPESLVIVVWSLVLLRFPRSFTLQLLTLYHDVS